MKTMSPKPLPKSLIRKAVTRLKSGIVFLYWRWKSRNFLRSGAKPADDQDRGPALDSGVPVPPPKFPPGLLAAAGFGEVGEQAFYGRSSR